VVVVVVANWLGCLFSVTRRGNYLSVLPQILLIMLTPVSNIKIVSVDTICFSIKKDANLCVQGSLIYALPSPPTISHGLPQITSFCRVMTLFRATDQYCQNFTNSLQLYFLVHI